MVRVRRSQAEPRDGEPHEAMSIGLKATPPHEQVEGDAGERHSHAVAASHPVRHLLRAADGRQPASPLCGAYTAASSGVLAPPSASPSPAASGDPPIASTSSTAWAAVIRSPVANARSKSVEAM